MSHPVCQIGDAVVIIGSVFATAATQIILATSPNSDLILLLLPLLGSMFASGAAILLNPEPETRRIVIGRSIFALVIGVAGPQLLGLAWEKFDATTIKPVILLFVGFIFAAVTYILSRPLFAQAYARSSAAASELLRRANITPEDENKPQ